LRDIGYHFPDTDPKYKGIDSKKLLAETTKIIRNVGFEIGNIDATVSLQKPKIKPVIPDMIKCLSEVMEIDKEDLSIKATTTEKLGFVGREEGVDAHAVVLIYKK
jgi:2-C-methyl-D-erythritol 2,4-cyclodiphosphate synthase